jgi:excinuclease UvrABC ATPase subunit
VEVPSVISATDRHGGTASPSGRWTGSDPGTPADGTDGFGYGAIEVRGARENNLRDVSLDIPKRRLTVFTGVSGSGKSSLVFGTIAAESQRLINETFTTFVQNFLPHYGRPDVDSLDNLSAAIIVDQRRMGGNSRSTVGTATDAASMLRIIFSRISTPHVGTSNFFSFNDPAGMCPACEGIGKAMAYDVDEMVDRDLSLNEGAIKLPNYTVGGWYWSTFATSGFFDPDKRLRDYSEEEWRTFLHAGERKIRVNNINVTFEGLIAKFTKTFAGKDIDGLQPHVRSVVDRVVTFAPCAECGGTRLNEASRTATVAGTTLPECAAMQVSDLAEWVRALQEPSVAPMARNLCDTLDRLVHIGLGYISLSRETSTLSGGESQRVKMVRHLGSSLTDITYIFDEPSIGLHAHDIRQFDELLLRLRDKGNTVLVVEHKPDVIAIADHVVDLGPGAGADGGQVVYQGDLPGLVASGTLTGQHLGRHQQLKAAPRRATGALRIEGADLNNLRDVTVDVPTGVLTVVTGVAGSGKSSLIHGYLPKVEPGAIMIDQNLPRGSRRSNPATYTGMLDPIRRAFARANGVQAALFSANSAGACPDCKGIGLIYTDLAFMDGMVSVCEACGGRRFTAEVLAHKLRGKDIGEVLAMSVADAHAWATEKPVKALLTSLVDVGLSYLSLGQPLTTLSGGERQRLKLATAMAKPGQVYVLDEPTTGLHMNDVDRLIALLDRLVDDGNTVVVIEHNLDVAARADWVIDLGPGAGHDGGTIVFEGPPAELVKHPASVTGEYLALRVGVPRG